MSRRRELARPDDPRGIVAERLRSIIAEIRIFNKGELAGSPTF